ncbi:MAG: class I SAM-dependent methyltransferase [Limnochordia bacterium]
MHDHYYSKQPKAAHRRHELRLELHGVSLALSSDSGVFSRHAIDTGTLLLLSHIPSPSGGHVLDIGCGYGPIGLFYAARCPSCTVHMSDVNERAVALSRENAARNSVTNVVVHSGAFPADRDLFFDLITTNPPIRAGRPILLELFEGARQRLRQGGLFAFVARTQQGAKRLATDAERIFGNVEDVARASGYRVYAARRHN